jgi:3-deoxy-manno-octulosonate cytidylyltransferase (CMP-KDO synthetase)
MYKAVGIIPARLAATRLPNKPLLDIGGKPMIQWVYERASRAGRLGDLYVATPDREIYEVVTGFGGKAVMTRPDHPSGTDRLAEAAESLPDAVQVVVNIQGDEPLIDPATIDAVADALLSRRPNEERTYHYYHGAGAGEAGAESAPDAVRQGRRPIVMASVLCPLPEGREADPNAVKVVCDRDGHALYFSRAPIPYRRDPSVDLPTFLHVGLYAYYRLFLTGVYPNLPRTPLEQAESLEQLRVLEHGYRIRMVRADHAPESVDTPEDLERVRILCANKFAQIQY